MFAMTPAHVTIRSRITKIPREILMLNRIETCKELTTEGIRSRVGSCPGEIRPQGHCLPWKVWKTLDRLRTKARKAKTNYTDGRRWKCERGEKKRTSNGLFNMQSVHDISALFPPTSRSIVVKEFHAYSIFFFCYGFTYLAECCGNFMSQRFQFDNVF